MRRPQNLKKISHLFWHLLSSVKTSGRFFQFFFYLLRKAELYLFVSWVFKVYSQNYTKVLWFLFPNIHNRLAVPSRIRIGITIRILRSSDFTKFCIYISACQKKSDDLEFHQEFQSEFRTEKQLNTWKLSAISTSEFRSGLADDSRIL